MCGAVATATLLPVPIRVRALAAYAAASFKFSSHERAVLVAAADVIVPGGQVPTPHGSVTVRGAGETGAVDYIENLLSGAMIFAAGVRRPPYVRLPPGVTSAPFPAAGTNPLWTLKRIAWYGDGPRPTRPTPWPSELARLQKLYEDGVNALDAATAPHNFDDPASAPLRDGVLRRTYADEVAAYNGHGEGNQPFVMTLLDHVAQACFGDPVYGGNRDYEYWKLIRFSGPSFISFGGPGPGQGWTAEDMAAPFDPAKVY